VEEEAMELLLVLVETEELEEIMEQEEVVAVLPILRRVELGVTVLQDSR
jgi:hypothetical protein